MGKNYLFMFNRRNFLKTLPLAGMAGQFNQVHALTSRKSANDYFGVHEFIENNPEAVFIMKTDIDVKTNDEAKKSAGMEFGRSVLVPKEDGVPITNLVTIKPKLPISPLKKYNGSMCLKESGSGISPISGRLTHRIRFF